MSTAAATARSAQYAHHYNSARPRRALQLRAPADAPDAIAIPGRRIRRPDVLDGLIHEYRNTA
ncbi:hypothetical protein [Streptomyces mirabilis]|uniref:hypothetical protein n=1 Tax=Streptomyces mirabilis TaxID=68239 RepID=UPI0036E08C0A